MNNFDVKICGNIPKRATPGSAGYDISAMENVIISPGEIKSITTGLYMELPLGLEAQIRSRSGLACKNIRAINIQITNLDSKEEIKILLQNSGLEDFQVSIGDRIAQMVFNQQDLNNQKVINVICNKVLKESEFGGYEIQSQDNILVQPGEIKLVSTGLYLEFPYGIEAQIREIPLLMKENIKIQNAPGTIDSDYRGEIKVILKNESQKIFEIKKNQNIAKIFFLKYSIINFILVESSNFIQSNNDYPFFIQLIKCGEIDIKPGEIEIIETNSIKDINNCQIRLIPSLILHNIKILDLKRKDKNIVEIFLKNEGLKVFHSKNQVIAHSTNSPCENVKFILGELSISSRGTGGFGSTGIS